MRSCWLGVASAEHARRGRAEGFMQACHGKGAPLRRMATGDGIVFYSPTVTFGGGDRLRAFTAIGKVQAGEPYRADRGDGFLPYRRDIAWETDAAEAPIEPLMQRLDLTAEKNWGYRLRFGLIPLTERDFQVIGEAMRVGANPTGAACSERTALRR